VTTTTTPSGCLPVPPTNNISPSSPQCSGRAEGNVSLTGLEAGLGTGLPLLAVISAFSFLLWRERRRRIALQTALPGDASYSSILQGGARPPLAEAASHPRVEADSREKFSHRPEMP
jgi:hypothetical protein